MKLYQSSALLSSLSRRAYLYFLLQLPGQPVGLYLKIIMSLKIHPELGLDSKVAVEAQLSIGSNRTPSMDDRVDAPGINADVPGQAILADSHRTDAPLTIDTDAALALPFSAKSLQMVCRWNAKGIEAGRCVQRGQFAHGNPLNIGR
jgi:hypothetical protein